MRDALLLLPLLFGGGCSREPPGLEQVSDDLEVQARYQTAYRTLGEIKRWKEQGRDVYADCQTVKMLFVKPLKQMQAKPARALAREIVEVCQDVKPR
jgi:hypothetical protein